MRSCVICFNKLNPSDEIRYPSYQHEGNTYVHKACLMNKVIELCQDERYERILRYVIEYEEEHKTNWSVEISGGSADSSWSREEIKLMSHEVKKLLDYKVIGAILSSNRSSSYSLCGRELLKGYLASGMEIESQKTITEEIFSPIFGFQDIKTNLVRAINSGKRIHTLFEGPPATGAKTTFMLCIEVGMKSGCYHAIGSRVTGPGLTEALSLYQPRVLLLDEVEKVSKSALSVLLSVMETGSLLETKHSRHGGMSVNTMVVAACNASLFLPPELLSRFKPYHIKFRPYTKQEFIDVCGSFLSKLEGLSEELAEYIAERVHAEFGTTDVREARGIARMLISKTREEVDAQVAFLNKYRKGS